MAIIESTLLPSGWTDMTCIRTADISRMGRAGKWHLQDNDPFFTHEVTATYLRSEYETETELRLDDLIAFFYTLKGYGFLVDDISDNHSTRHHGSGVVLNYGGDLRLFKRTTFLGKTYDHPITRPKAGVVLAGGAAGGSVASDTGIVTGEGVTTGTWAGGFYRPMIFGENGLRLRYNNEGVVEAVDVTLLEEIEI